MKDFLQFKGILPCVRKMGLTEACIDYFAKNNLDKFRDLAVDNSTKVSTELPRPFEDCVNWMTENKDSEMGKKCMAQENSVQMTKCAHRIHVECKFCILALIHLLQGICLASCYAGYGCL